MTTPFVPFLTAIEVLTRRAPGGPLHPNTEAWALSTSFFRGLSGFFIGITPQTFSCLGAFPD